MKKRRKKAASEAEALYIAPAAGLRHQMPTITLGPPVTAGNVPGEQWCAALAIQLVYGGDSGGVHGHHRGHQITLSNSEQLPIPEPAK